MTTLAQRTGLLLTYPDSTWIRGTDSPLILWIPPNTKLDHSGGLGLSLQYSSHLEGHVCGTDTQPLSQGSSSAFAGTARRTQCPRRPLTFTILAVGRAGMDTLPGLRGSCTCCAGGTLHLLQSDRPLLVRAVANSPPDSAAGHSQAHPCRSHLIPSGHGAPVLTWPWLPGDPCLPPGSTTDVFLSTQERSSATSPRPWQLHPLHGAGRSGARSRALREQRAPAGRRRGPARHRHRRVSSAP